MVAGILVLYNPNKGLLRKVLDSLTNQVEYIYISDNSDVNHSEIFENIDKVKYVWNGCNIGIAKAQNNGVAWSRKIGATCVLFLDQDSILEKNLVTHLLETIRELEAQGIQVGAVGPTLFNRFQEKDLKGTFRKGKSIFKDVREVQELISSASLIPLKNFETVGLFEDNLFIDVVDFEWCWRAAFYHDLRFFRDSGVRLNHAQGEGDKFVLFVRISVSAPIRMFYQYRNYIMLLSRIYVPSYWKFSNGIKLFFKAIYLPICVGPFKDYVNNIRKGISHGCANRSIRLKRTNS